MVWVITICILFAIYSVIEDSIDFNQAKEIMYKLRISLFKRAVLSKEVGKDVTILAIEGVNAVANSMKAFINKQINRLEKEIDLYMKEVIKRCLEDYLSKTTGNDMEVNEGKIVNSIREFVQDSYSDILEEIKVRINQNNNIIIDNMEMLIKDYTISDKYTYSSEIEKEISKVIEESIEGYSNNIEKLLDTQIINLKRNMDNELEVIKVEMNNSIDVDLLETKFKEYTENMLNQYEKNKDKQVNDILSDISHQFTELKENINLETIKKNISLSLIEIEEKYENTIQKNIDNLLELSKELSKLNTSHSEILENKKVRLKFEEAFRVAESEINIISPWISNNVIYNTKIDKSIDMALQRGIKVKIIYGICGSNNNLSNKRGDIGDKIAKELREKFHQYDDRFLIEKGNTHEKILLCDDKFMLIGSFNFLSFDGEYTKDCRNEIAAVITEKGIIEELRLNKFNI